MIKVKIFLKKVVLDISINPRYLPDTGPFPAAFPLVDPAGDLCPYLFTFAADVARKCSIIPGGNHIIYHQSEQLDMTVEGSPMIPRDKLKIPKKGIPKIDLIFAVLLLVATLSTAFCVYQATRWNGIQAVDFGESAKLRTESIRATTMGNSQVIIDVQLYLSWVDAKSKGDQIQADFIEERFRDEFRPAFEAWIALAGEDPDNPIAPGSPFDLPEYTVARYNESILLEENATAAFNRGKDANQNGDSYISNTVLFAIIMFFCGVYTRWDSIRIRQGILVITLVIFTYAVFLLVSLLIRVGYV